MNQLNTKDMIDFLSTLADQMLVHEDRLRELDAQIGDGDLGISVTLGMKGMKEGLLELADEDMGNIIARSGTNFNRAGASTFGAIFATGLLRAGQQVREHSTITVADLARMFEAAVEGIKQRGGAEVGDKTVLDVIVPMAEELKQAADSSADLLAAVQASQQRCHQALEETAAMEGKHGRAGWLKEKTVGVPDPGATAIALMMDCFLGFVQRRARE